MPDPGSLLLMRCTVVMITEEISITFFSHFSMCILVFKQFGNGPECLAPSADREFFNRLIGSALVAECSTYKPAHVSKVKFHGGAFGPDFFIAMFNLPARLDFTGNIFSA